MFAIPKFTLLVGASLFCGFSAAVTSPDSCQLVNPFCAPSGLNIEYYRNYLGNYSEGNFPSSYYITEGLKPLVSSYTNRTFFPQNGAPTPAVCYPPVTVLPQDGPYFVGWTRTTNGNIIVDANNFTLVYSGYYRAPATGTYNLCSAADNRNEIYMGDGETYRRFLTWGVTWLSHRELSVGNEEHRGAKRWLETGVSKRRVRFEVEAGHYRFGR